MPAPRIRKRAKSGIVNIHDSETGFVVPVIGVVVVPVCRSPIVCVVVPGTAPKNKVLFVSSITTARFCFHQNSK